MSLFSDLSIKAKLSVGFGSLILLLMLSNLFGFRGIETIHDSVIEIGDRNAPTMDAANRLATTLLKGQSVIQEIDSRTTVIAANATDAELNQLLQQLTAANAQFDEIAGSLVDANPQGNSELVRLVEQADRTHNEAFQPQANRLIELGRARVAAKTQLTNAMTLMEGRYSAAADEADRAETAVKRWVAEASTEALDTESALGVLNGIVPYVDAMMELKIAILEARVSIEEIVQQNALSRVTELYAEYQSANAHFDTLISATLQGGEVDGEQVNPLPSGDVRDAVVALDRVHADFQAASDQIVALQRQLLELTAQAGTTRTQLFATEAQVAEVVEAIKALSSQRMQAAKGNAETGYANALSLLGGIVLLATLAGVLMGWAISRSVTQPLSRAVQFAKQLAAGDLTAKVAITSKDETGQLLSALNETSSKLQDLVTQIAASTEQLASATNEVSTVTSQTARNIQIQSNHLDQASVAMNEMSATVREVAQNATEAAAATRRSDDEAKQGRRVVGQVDLSVRDLAQQIEQAKGAIHRLGAETEKMGSILEVITGIAEQTNLLALNAAIEAARAGEQGRGFAVVADEVRSLASRTQESTSTIQSMIATLNSEARQSVSAMDEGGAKAGSVVQLSEQAAHSLAEIERAVGVIAQMNIQIASAAEEQSAVAEEVNATVHQINETEAETSAGAQQVAVATEELAQLSDNLKTLVSQFKVA